MIVIVSIVILPTHTMCQFLHKHGTNLRQNSCGFFLCQSRKATSCFTFSTIIFTKCIIVIGAAVTSTTPWSSLCASLITWEPQLLPLKASVIHSLVIVGSRRKSLPINQMLSIKMKMKTIINGKITLLMKQACKPCSSSKLCRATVGRLSYLKVKHV